MSKKNSARKLHRYKNILTLVVIVIAFSAILTTPAGELKYKLLDSLPLLSIGFIVTEILFVVGLLTMVIATGYKLSKNPLNWHNELKQIAKKVNDSKTFWVGFWTNTVGAFGTGLVLAYGVVRVLPIASWVLLWIPILDIILTFALRSAILRASEKLHTR